VTDGLLSNEHPLWVRAAMGILIVFVAPVVEEMFFRGYAYNIFKKRLNTTQALFYSSLLFAAVHMYLIHFLPIFYLGLNSCFDLRTQANTFSSYHSSQCHEHVSSHCTTLFVEYYTDSIPFP